MIEPSDPFPRELIDVWPLHDARQELLEEIVSQPGNDQSPTRRILVPVGIAAALLLVVGGAWAAISAGGNADDGNHTVAASVVSTAADPTPTTSEATEASGTSGASQRPRHQVRRHGERTSRAVTLRNLDECLRVLSRAGAPRDHLRLRRVEHRKGRDYTVYVVRKGHRIVAVDGHCRTRLVKGGRVRRH